MNIQLVDTNRNNPIKPISGKSPNEISRIMSDESLHSFRKESVIEPPDQSELNLNPIEFFNQFIVDKKSEIKALESISKKSLPELQNKINSKLGKLKNKFKEDSNIFDYLKQHEKITARLNTVKKPETFLKSDAYYELLADYVLYKLESDETKNNDLKLSKPISSFEASLKNVSINEKEIHNVLLKIDHYTLLKAEFDTVNLNQPKTLLDVSKLSQLQTKLKKLKEDISQNLIFDAKVIRKSRESGLVDF